MKSEERTLGGRVTSGGRVVVGILNQPLDAVIAELWREIAGLKRRLDDIENPSDVTAAVVAMEEESEKA